MTDEYDPRQDPIAPTWEKNYYDYFETCMINGRYKDGLVVLEKEKDLPQYMIDKFKEDFENKLEEGRRARNKLEREIR